MKDILWASLDRAVEWVKYAESKGLAILGVHAVTLGFFLSIVVERNCEIRSSFWIMVSLAVALVSAFVSIFFSFRCLNPRLRLSGGLSPIYFRSVAESFPSSTPFLVYLKERMADDEKIETEVAGQVYLNFVIASKKFTDVTWALRFLVLSLPFWVLVAILLIFV